MNQIAYTAGALLAGCVVALRMRHYSNRNTQMQTNALAATALYFAYNIAPARNAADSIVETCTGIMHATHLLAMIALTVALNGVATHALCAAVGSQKPRAYTASANVIFIAAMSACYLANGERIGPDSMLAKLNILNWAFASWLVAAAGIVLAVTLQSRPRTNPEKAVTFSLLAGSALIAFSAIHRAVTIDMFANVPPDQLALTAGTTGAGLAAFTLAGYVSCRHHSKIARPHRVAQSA